MPHHLKKNNLVNEQETCASSPSSSQVAASLPKSGSLNEKLVDKRWNSIDDEAIKNALFDSYTQNNMACYRQNIEHFIGTANLPIGLAGPLLVNGQYASGEYLVPLATTEAALVASYDRGASLIHAAGGVQCIIVDEGVSRTPCFVFNDVIEAAHFVTWASSEFNRFTSIAEQTTSHGKVKKIDVQIEGNYVFLVFEYLTGDASGQNMVTIATNAVFDYIKQNSPVAIKHAYLDGNLSGDKKSNTNTLLKVRGKKVISDISIPRALVEKYLHTTPEEMVKFAEISTLGAMLNGSVGVNAHYANGLAALYIACGQDAACVAESAIGVTRMVLNEQGDLYVTITMPNIMVGTVGGGTGLPTQKACLDILGVYGSGGAKALAEITAATCLAGELSIVGAFCAGHFSRAHQKLARGKNTHI
ncbi:hydroxymethylglutaryl-CoA reductase [Vibrio sp. RC27]